MPDDTKPRINTEDLPAPEKDLSKEDAKKIGGGEGPAGGLDQPPPPPSAPPG